MRHIKIGIPEITDVRRWIDILRFKLTGGFSCTKCGSKSDFNHVRFDSTVHNQRLILENRTGGICPECTREELNKKASIVFTEDNCNCDWCDESKSTMSFPRHADLESCIIFGGRWWNGHHICQDCMNIGFDNRGPTYSSHSKHANGMHYQLNELGLWIKVK